MKEREYLLSLYELYNKLLNEKERDYFENYYYEDLSLQEIADNNKVSKSYVGKLLNNIEKKINNYELSLSLYKRNNEIRNIIENLEEEVKNKIDKLL